MKKVFLVLLVSVFTLSFNACNNKSDDKDNKDKEDIEAIDEEDVDEDEDDGPIGHANFNGDVKDAVKMQLEYIGEITEALAEAIEDDKITEAEAEKINEITEEANEFSIKMAEEFDEEATGIALIQLMGEEEEIAKIYEDYLDIMFKYISVEGWDLIQDLE